VRLLLSKRIIMKPSTDYRAAVLGLILALSAVPGHAQDGAKVKANIPFNFVVGGKELRAGDYVIESSLEDNILRFRSEDGGVQQIAFTVPIETNRTGSHERLLFHHDGDQYFLSQVWLSGDENGLELIPGVLEKGSEKGRAVSDHAAGGY
jgi:hypothetical protein